MPNTEFGHLKLDGVMVNRLLGELSMMLQPDLIVIGGGVSDPRRVRHWRGLLRAEVEVVLAALANRADLIGAAIRAALVDRS